MSLSAKKFHADNAAMAATSLVDFKKYDQYK